MRKLLGLLLLAALPAFAQYGPSGNPSTSNSAPFQVLAKTSRLAASTSSANIALASSAIVGSVAITGTAGQFSCTCSYLTVGMGMTISGTFGGTGSIAGYVNPTTYSVSAVGSGTFSLTGPGGTALVTTVGTPTGLTYTANATATQNQIEIINTTAATAYIIACPTSSCTASAGTAGTSTSDYPIAPGSDKVYSVPVGTTYVAAVLSAGGGEVTFTPGVGL